MNKQTAVGVVDGSFFKKFGVRKEYGKKKKHEKTSTKTSEEGEKGREKIPRIHLYRRFGARGGDRGQLFLA